MYLMYVVVAASFFLIFTNAEINEGIIHDKHRRSNTCMGLGDFGYTYPEGDITIRYGEPLNITCTLYNSTIAKSRNKNNGNELSSSDLYFYRRNTNIYPNNEYDPNDKTAERVKILNETSIQYYVEKPDLRGSYMIFCHFNDSTPKQHTICTNMVVVGLPPQNVTDFSCASENFERLICNWTAPENYVNTHYTIHYKFKMTHPSFICPTNTTLEDNISRKMSCELTLFTNPQYRQSRRTYIFMLHANNTFGETNQTFIFDHYRRMHPYPVEKLEAVATSPHSILLTWRYTNNVDAFPERIEGKILYNCEFCNNSWTLDNNTFISETFKKKVTRFELKSLLYAHALYDIQISIKPIEADEEMWSDPAGVTKRTESKLPDRPPSVTQGSFQVVNINNVNRDVYVYFQTIKESEQNGQNFTYVINIEPHGIVESTKTFVKFEKLREDQEYVIRIWSKNEIGKSELSSRVVIPKNSIPEPPQFIKIGHGLKSYKLQWEPPKISQPITNYTIFWCMNERDRPYQCTGYLDWATVSNDTREYKTTLTNDIYQFAIAANTEIGSSGMRWAECTVLNNGTIGKIRNIWVNSVGPNFIELRWKLDCSDIVSEVVGYVIYYCKTRNQIISETGCDKDEIRNITVNGNLNLQSATVTNLEPYTSYELALSVKSNKFLSTRSAFLRNVTSESAPSSPPRNILVTKITNTSISLEWLPPNKSNGYIRHYYIHYNNLTVDAKTATRETISNLESYTKYTIYLVACTQHCSNMSEGITVRTQIGPPAKIIRPFVLPNNDTSDMMSNIISWDKPHPPRGELDYYQMRITGANVVGEEITNFTKTDNYTIQNCRDAGYYSFSVSVRAVNIVNGTHLPGLWSDNLLISCYKSSWYIIVIAAGAILTCVIIFVGCRRLYICWSIARDVEIKLPPGLAPDVENSEKNSDIIDRSFDHDPDEELLLDRLSDKCPAGDSSGCSSGQISITSSVESTHLSVDSGTDQPRNVNDDNKENSLRQRNVPIKGYVMHDLTPVINRGTKPTPPPAGNYCLIGVDPSTKPPLNTPYVTISDLEHSISPYIASDLPTNTPPPYIMTDIFKTPNPGYVPFSPKEPASKNTGYVVAGDLTSTPAPETKPEYLVMDTQVGLKPTTVWQQPSIEPSLTKPGYVSVGDAPPPVAVKEAKQGYVSHRQFESKALKED